MKSIVAFVFFVSFCPAVFGQKYVPVIKEGSVLSYDAFSKGLGQHVQLTLTIKSLADPVKMQWDVEGYGTGTFEMPAKALQSGTKVVIKQPDPDGVTQLNDDETMIVISKATFGNLIKDKAFDINDKKYIVTADTATYKISDKAADLFYAVSLNGKSELWIINNPDFPIVYKARNVTRGVDFTLTGIKE